MSRNWSIARIVVVWFAKTAMTRMQLSAIGVQSGFPKGAGLNWMRKDLREHPKLNTRSKSVAKKSQYIGSARTVEMRQYAGTLITSSNAVTVKEKVASASG